MIFKNAYSNFRFFLKKHLALYYLYLDFQLFKFVNRKKSNKHSKNFDNSKKVITFAARFARIGEGFDSVIEG